LRIPYYATFNRYTEVFQIYRLVAGKYQPLTPNNQGIWLPEAELGLGFWSGTFQGIERSWLRWYDEYGGWVLTPAELAVLEKQRAESEKQRAESEKQRAESEKQRAESEKQRAESEKRRADWAESQLEQERQQRQRLIERLQALGIDPETEINH
jgi:hypothetical protein